MASLLMSMAKPSGDREDRFLKDVEALCGSDEFRRRKVSRKSHAQLTSCPSAGRTTKRVSPTDYGCHRR